MCKLYTTGYLDILDKVNLGQFLAMFVVTFLMERRAMSSWVCGDQIWVFFVGSWAIYSRFCRQQNHLFWWAWDISGYGDQNRSFKPNHDVFSDHNQVFFVSKPKEDFNVFHLFPVSKNCIKE